MTPAEAAAMIPPLTDEQCQRIAALLMSVERGEDDG